MKLLILFLMLTTSVFAKSYNQTYSYDGFYKAKIAPSFLRFDMASTKMGMISSDFYGVVKKMTISFDMKKNIIKNAIVSFKVIDMDTDVNDRNKKMYNLCFSKDKFPDIIVTLNGSFKIGKTQKSIDATINVRGKNKPIKVILDVTKKGRKLIVTGLSKTKLSALEIPDPSIWIAKIRDEVELKFNFEIDL